MYQYEIPDGVQEVHIKTTFYGTSRIIFTNYSTPQNFNQDLYKQFPESGYAVPTDINEIIETDGFKYVYVTLYVSSGNEPRVTYSTPELLNYLVAEEKALKDTVDDIAPLTYTNEQQLSDLKTGFRIEYKQSKNRFNKNLITNGKTFDADGSLIDGTSNDNVSDYIPVNDLTGIVIGSYNTDTWTILNTYIVAYDYNKNVIGRRSATGSTAYTIPSGAYYIRFRFSTSYTNYIMTVSSEDAVTQYEQYFEPYTDYLSGIVEAVNKNIFVGVGKDYTSFSEAIINAVQYENSQVYVDDGIYDIEVEFKNLFGSTFFDNFNTNSQRGLFLGNGIKLYLSPNTIVQFHYTGNNQDVLMRFSPFNFAPYNTYSSQNYRINGFKIHGGIIDAKNCRYCVHDDPSSFNKAYINVYDGVTMILDNTENQSWGSKACIGAGLGTNGKFVVKNCVFESVGSNDTTCSLSVHNSKAAGAKSVIEIRNNYFKGNNTARILWDGTSTKLTTALVCGNSVTRQIQLAANDEDSLIENIELISWNNEIRQLT